MTTRLRTLAARVLGASAVVATAAAAGPALYLLAATATAAVADTRTAPDRRIRRGRDVGHREGRRSTSERPRRFAVLVAAHDEADVIVETVRALRGQDYPPDRFEIHVVADNCTDATAELAKVAGAEAHERIAPDAPGKGHALNWLIDRLDLDCFDAVVIIDADTVASESFLWAMDHAFAAGAVVAQGYYGVLRPETSPAVGLRYAALACRHHLRPLARRSWGCSCGLYGNGMAVDVSVMDGRRWSGHLIEDAEFQNDLLLDGITVRYVPEARIAAEMPATLAASVTQHQRWELGRAQLIRRFVRPLIAAGVRGGPLRRRVYFDAVADHVLPPLSTLAALDGLAFVMAGAGTVLRPDRRSLSVLVVAAVAPLILAAHVIVALRLVRAPRTVYASLAEAPQLVAWKLGLLKRVAARPDDVAWTRTARNMTGEVGTVRA